MSENEKITIPPHRHFLNANILGPIFFKPFFFLIFYLFILERHKEREAETQAEGEAGSMPVSYTHLTLPTTRLRCRSRWSPYH